MKRRYFLSISTLALAGLVTRVSAENHTAIVTDATANVRRYFTLLDAGFVSEDDLSQDLINSIALGEESYKATGYKSLDNGVFTFSDRLIARVVQLTHAELGVLESGVLFYAKQVSGDWKKYTSFSGFQVRAIVGEILESGARLSSTELRRLWLPLENKKSKFDPNGYVTEAGELSISTEIGDRDAFTEIRRSSSQGELSLGGAASRVRRHQVAIQFSV